MGFNITIGEANLEYYLEDHAIHIGVDLVNNENAPNYSEFTGDGNMTSISYGGMRKLCMEAKIFELFYGIENGRARFGYNLSCSSDFHREIPLITDGFCTSVICEDDYELIKKAKLRWENEYELAIPGFKEGEDWILARLKWLEFWFRWALDNCECAVIKFS